MKISGKSFILFFAFFVSIYFCRGQKITLIPKNHVFYNISTGSSTSDRSYTFIVEGDSNPRKAGYFGQHLKNYVRNDSQAVKYLRSYSTHQAFKLATSVSTVILFSTFAISNLSKESVSQENLDKPSKNRGFLYASIGTLASNLIFRIIQPKSIQRAVNSYNQKNEKKEMSFNSFYFNLQNISDAKALSAGLKIDF
jgi:hypothetical protein